MAVKFTRTLQGGETGPDVEGIGRALARGGYLDGIAQFVDKTPGVRRTYGPAKRRAVNKIRATLGMPLDGVYDRKVHEFLKPDFDAYAAKLMLGYRPPPTLYFPIAGDPEAHATVCQNLHPTGGLEGNWAIDVCAKPGSAIVAVEKGTIYRFSGSPPGEDMNDPAGVYGWSTYFASPGGYLYFVTHQGRRLPSLEIGMVVQAGDTIGYVGDQEYRPDHTHYGVSSPKGERDAKARITSVSRAPRIH